MKTIPSQLILLLQRTAIGALGLGVFLVVTLGAYQQPAHALPEYAEQTGEPCAACHVNPGGGGPRTLRGLLWAARGKPEALPALPGVLLAPGVLQGQELYEIACAGCHGYQGEGLSAMGLAGTGISSPAIRSYLLAGIPALGMPAFTGQLDPNQVDLLVEYVARLSSGEIEPPAAEIDLPEAQLGCDWTAASSTCGGK